MYFHHSKKLYFITCAVAAIGFSSCSDPKEAELPNEEGTYVIKGYAEKGPFVSGSTITIQELDQKLNPTGRTFNETVINDEGYFDAGSLELISPYVRLSAIGYYYNEVTGQRSDEPIILNALANLKDAKPQHINLFTHLKEGRVSHYVKKEKLAFAAAGKKAQEELYTSLNIAAHAATDASEISIASGSHEAGALIAISSVLLRVNDGNEFADAIRMMANQLTNDGRFSNQVKNAIVSGAQWVDFEQTATSIIDLYAAMDKRVEVKNLRQFIDWDGNGVAGDESFDWDGKPVLEFEADTLFIPQEGGNFQVKLKGNLAFSFDKPAGWPDIVEIKPFELWESAPLAFEKSIGNTGNEITLQVAPTSYRFVSPQKITVYSTYGSKSASLVIIQKGNQAAECKLSADGANYIADLENQMGRTYSWFHTMEAFYTNSWKAPWGIWTDFEQHQLTSHNAPNNTGFTYGYGLLAHIRYIRHNTDYDTYTRLLCHNLEALIYTDMLSFWGQLGYVEKIIEQPAPIPYESENELLARFEGSLQALIPLLSDRTSNLFITSADVPRFTLARIYMAKGAIQEALPLLEEIIASNRYRFNDSRQNALSTNSTEMIFPLKSGNTSQNIFANTVEKNSYFAVMPYTEVVLRAAECAMKMGDPVLATRYLKQVAAARNTLYDASASFIEQLHSVWQQELKGSNSYFSFLKRNDLATTTLNIETFRQLFPIPQVEIDNNSGVKQNPGY